MLNLDQDDVEDGAREKFRHAKFQKYINMMTIMTNCLTSKEICRSLLEHRNFKTLKVIGQLFHWFHE